MFEKKRRKIIIQQFQNIIKDIFLKDLVFAFICGGFTRKKYTGGNDLDMFICVKKITPKTKRRFHKWYILIHSQYGFKPDLCFGEEIVVFSELLKKIRAIEYYQPISVIKDINIYDGIVWAGMLSGKSVGFMGNIKIFKQIKAEASQICKKWVKTLSSSSKIENPDLILKKIIKYKPCTKTKI